MSPLVGRMLRAARLEPALYEEVEADPSALSQAMLVVLLAAVAAGIGSVLLGPRAILLGAASSLVGWFVRGLLFWVVGTRFMPEPQTSADLGQVLRATGFASAPGVLRVFGVVPGFGVLIVGIAQIWMVAAMVVAIRQALDYSGVGRALVVCVIGWVAYIILSFLLSGVTALQVL